MAKIRTRARALDMLGRQQIAGIPTALNELFKNAHDAYADNVEVDFVRKRNLLILRDDGLGMTREEFESRWLTIGTDSKYSHAGSMGMPSVDLNKSRRVVMGEKGIGRLAIAAIGPQVLVLTRSKKYIDDTNSNKHSDDNQNVKHNYELSNLTVAFVNWSLFELPGLDLEEIDIPMLEVPGGEYLSTEQFHSLINESLENVLKIEDKLNSEYLKNNPKETTVPDDLFGLQTIKSQLDSFSTIDPSMINRIGVGPSLVGEGHGTHFIISPIDEALIDDIGDFASSVKNDASRLEKGLLGFTNTMHVDVRPPILAKFRYHTLSNEVRELIGENAFFTSEEYLKADHHIVGEFNEFGQFNGKITIYGEESKDYTLSWTEGGNRFTKCGPFRFNLAYVQGSAKDSKLPYDIWKDLTLKTERIGGLYVYRDGIRILPYGDVDYDFLQIEKRRTLKASTAFFSYRRMIGFIELTKDNNSFLQEKAGREGFIENKAFREFKSILENLFIQVAIDIFNKSGDYSDFFLEKKDRLNKDHENLKKRSKTVSHQRKKLLESLNEFFKKSHEKYWEIEVEKTVKWVQQKIENENNFDDHLEDFVFGLENKIHIDFKKLIEELEISKPAGLGLTKSLGDDWDSYQVNKQEIYANIIKPAKRKLETMLLDFEGITKSPIEIKNRLSNSIEQIIESYDKEIRNKVSNLNNLLNDLQKLVSNDIKTSRENAKSEFSRTFSDFLSTDVYSKSHAELAVIKETVESKLEQTTSQITTKLDDLTNQLNSSKFGNFDDSISSSSLIASLESQLELIKEEHNNNMELAQLGMAIGVIHHEFESHIRSVRRGIKELQPLLARSQKATHYLNNIRASFDHLDGYLKLFTPLGRRLTRKKVYVSGSVIYSFVRDLFEEKLEENDIELIFDSSFKESSMFTYTSSLLPAFVNIIDNSIYWLSRSENRRYIKLGAIEDGFYITDSGPGIPIRDRLNIFEFGFTRKPHGRGMGLYVTKQTLNQVGLDLELGDYSSDEGATFLIKNLELGKQNG
ncbi:ATP-binding protein [Photobacterium ganghwense]|uniref:ATP-binding protein n=1 Tax=Photobacterium ganghwense TaxID=320778 RepID=UPI001A8C4ECC|nr:ATP-binding protein [Photobacterium ganghwense]QSV15858.1 ATP-binding protein [Photobacterium ganghwense]